MPGTFDPSNDEQVQALLSHYSEQLHAHGFDSVRIFVTLPLPDGNCRMRTGAAGQWYASYGAIDQWLACEKAKMAEQARSEFEDDDE